MSDVEVPKPRRRSAGKLFLQHVGKHVEIEKQIGRTRYHVSWPTAEEAWDEIAAFLETRKRAISIRALLKQLPGGSKTDVIRLPGPKGEIAFREFCTEVLPTYREHMGGWLFERHRLSWIVRNAPFVNRLLHEIRAEDISEFYHAYATRPTILSDNTRGKMANTLRAIFRTATRAGYLIHDPSEGLKRPPVPPSRRNALHLSEARRLIRAADPTTRRWLLIGIYTGLRRGEIARLQTGNLDLRECFLYVTGTTVKNRPREIHVHDDLLPILQECASTAPALPLLRTPLGEPQRFPRAAFERARAGAGLVKYSFLDLRHTFCSWLLEYGTDSEAVIGYLMGHKRRTMTSHYTHIPRRIIRKAIENLPSVLTFDAETEEEAG